MHKKGCIRRFLRLDEQGVFIDVRAHVGKYTIQIAKLVKRGKVIALEPHP